MGACLQTNPHTYSVDYISRAIYPGRCYKGADQAEDTRAMALTHRAL